MSASTRITAPDALVTSLSAGGDPVALRWIREVPELAEAALQRWDLRPDGAVMHGMAALVLPVLQRDGAPAALKLQPTTAENLGEGPALTAWNGDGAVQLLAENPDEGALLLERLDASRPLSVRTDDDEITRTIAGLLLRLHRAPAPEGLRRLSDIAGEMVERTPREARALRDPAEGRLLRRFADETAELLDEAGHTLLHWDLHRDNVLGASRAPWLAIDPKPLLGDPGFELLPALRDDIDGLNAGIGVRSGLQRRLDILLAELDLDADRAVAWTRARLLQDALWSIADGADTLSALTHELHSVLATRG